MNDISPLCLRFERASERGGYPASGEFDQNGEFGKSDNLTTFRRKDLDFSRLAKEGELECGEFHENGEFGERDDLMTFRHTFEMESERGGIQKAANSTKMANLAKVSI